MKKSIDRHLHNLRVLRIREAQKAQREKAGLTSATAKATELISHLLKDGLVENRAKIGLFIKAFVAGFCARQRLVGQTEDGHPSMDPTPFLRQHLLATARGQSTSAADTSVASSAFLRGFKESSSFSESGDQTTAPILMGIIDVSSCNAAEEEASTARAYTELTAHAKAQQQLPLLINQAEKTLEEVDRALQMLSHALALNRLKKTEPPTPWAVSPTSKTVEDCRNRTAKFLAKIDGDVEGEDDINERPQTLDEAADQALRKMSRALNDDRRAEKAAERAAAAVYEGQAIASPSALPLKPLSSTSASAAFIVASDAIIRAKNIGRQAKTFDGNLSARIEGALRHMSPSPPRKQEPPMPPPLTPYQQALDKYHNGGKAAQMKIESNAVVNSPTRIVQHAEAIPPPSKTVSRELCPPPPPRISQSRSPEKVTSTSERPAASIGNDQAAEEASSFMATTAAFESRRQSSAANREEKLRARDRKQAMMLATTTARHPTVRRTSARGLRTGVHKRQIWRGAGSASSKQNPLEKQSEQSRAALRASEERNKRDELAERSRSRRRKKSGMSPAPPRSPDRPGRRARFVEQVEAAERLHRSTEGHQPQGK